MSGSNDAKLNFGGSFAISSGTFQLSDNSRAVVTGNLNQSGGTISSLNYADIRIRGNFSSTAGTFNASGYSFLTVAGIHTIDNYNSILILSGNAQVQVNGTTTTLWNTLNVIENSCYKSTNRVAGVGCVLCGATYTTDGTFTVELLDKVNYKNENISVRIIAATGQYDLIQSYGYTSLSAEVSKRLTSKPIGIYTLEISWGIYREYHKVVLLR
jgi:hypothetical protein